MTWPWVSRALYDVVLFQRDTSRTDEKMRESIAIQRQMEWSDALRHERDRYDVLLARYHALKLAGAVVVEPPAAPIAAPIVPVDPVKQAIRQQVRSNPDMRGLEGYLTKYAAELRDVHNLPADKVIAKLGQWESSESMSEPGDSIVAVPAADGAA